MSVLFSRGYHVDHLSPATRQRDAYSPSFLNSSPNPLNRTRLPAPYHTYNMDEQFAAMMAQAQGGRTRGEVTVPDK